MTIEPSDAMVRPSCLVAKSRFASSQESAFSSAANSGSLRGVMGPVGADSAAVGVGAAEVVLFAAAVDPSDSPFVTSVDECGGSADDDGQDHEDGAATPIRGHDRGFSAAGTGGRSEKGALGLFHELPAVLPHRRDRQAVGASDPRFRVGPGPTLAWCPRVPPCGSPTELGASAGSGAYAAELVVRAVVDA